ncbi:MAG: chromosomal replication initiator protein DnaA [Deltaproteobacteria bacterium]|nr:chromosomal replication initiator protein DnaA [Deltaproteobacteria bacterium]
MSHRKDIWVDVSKSLESKMSKGEFKTWFSRTSLKRFDPEVVVLGVPNKFVATWLNDNYLIDIKKSFKKIARISPSIHFSYDHEAMEKEPREVEKSESYLKRRLNPSMTFETFMTGECNRFAWSTAREVAEKRTEEYNLLYLYCVNGLGKTHLLHAIGNHRLKKNPRCRLRYLSSDAFSSDFTYSIKNDRLDDFRSDLSNLDLLLFDDIHHLANREKTQEEFLSVFNALYSQKQQLVITGDSAPNKLRSINPELKSRLGWGLLADIDDPDQALKISIIQKEAAEDNLSLAEDVVFFLSNSSGDIKNLLKNMIRVQTFASLSDEPVTISTVRTLIRDRNRSEITLEDIMTTTAGYFNISMSDLLSNKKNRIYSYPRQLAMYLARKFTNLSFKEIGNSFNHKDHSTVIHALRKVEKEKDEKKDVEKDLSKIESLLG